MSGDAASVTLAWDPNQEPDVAGYRLYYGTPAGTFDTVVNTGNVTNHTVVDLHPGATYSFYVTCYNTSGLESEPSNVVEYTVPSSGINQPPTANPQSVRVPAGRTIEIVVEGTDPDSDPLTFTLVELPSLGIVHSYPPRILYTAPTNFVGTLPFSFTANDGFLESATATVEIEVLPPNQKPVALPRSLSVAGDEPVWIELSGTDPEGTPLDFRVTAQPLHGILEGTPPDLIYWPDPGYTGPDAFAFQAGDGWDLSVPAQVQLMVLAGNRAPVVTASPDLLVTLPGLAYLRGSATDDGLPLGGPGVSLEWHQLDGPNIATLKELDSGVARVAFARPGTYSFRLVADDGALSASEDVQVVVQALPVGSHSVASTLFLEAESGTLTNAMTVAATAPTSSGGRIVTYTTTPRSDSGFLTLPFEAAAAGSYLVWCRVQTRSGGTDSFYVAVDGGAEDIFDASGEEFGPDWKWTLLTGRGGLKQPYTLANAISPIVLNLDAGPHQIRFRGREVGTHLDAVIITGDPSFNPTAAENASTPSRLQVAGQAPGQWGCTWTTIPGRHYQLLSKDRLDDAWTAVGPSVQALSTSLSHSAPAGVSHRFYAVSLLAP